VPGGAEEYFGNPAQTRVSSLYLGSRGSGTISGLKLQGRKSPLSPKRSTRRGESMNSMIRTWNEAFVKASDFVSRGLRSKAQSSLVLFALTFVLASCGGSTGSSNPVPTASLTATPSTIVSGQNITLTWASTNADMGTIDQGVGTVGLNGNTVLSPGIAGYPTGTTNTYTYTASGPGGTATATATITVSLVTSFDGMIYSDSPLNANDVDPNGAVGTKQYMEYVNNFYQAYDKVTKLRVWPKPQSIATPWAGVGGPCYLNALGLPFIQLDAVIDFDRLASRWVITGKTTEINNYFFCIAVSSTDDLTSSSLTWQAYDFKLAVPGVLGTNALGNYYFPDWPKFGTWPDGYYVTMDEQDKDNGNAEIGVLVCAFDRPDILNNSGSIKNAACATVPAPLSGGLFLGHSLIPADVDGTTAPPVGRDEFMVSIENPVNDGSTQQGPTTQSTTFNLWDFHVNWTASPAPTLTLVQQSTPTVTTYIPGCYLYAGVPAITNCVPENRTNGGEIVDSVGDRFMPRFAYRNYGSYESFLISHTVQTGPGPSNNTPDAYQTGIRWYQLTDNGSGTPAVSQSGTINPDASLYRFLPSIAQDHSGNVAVGYSVSNALDCCYPGINMSYWNLTESAATAPTEVTIFDGTGEEVTPTTGVGKWGSYSSMTVDPVDDCTFWYVNEYFFTDNTWRTRIANFKVPGCQ
jgi:hypothetical protein